MGNCVTKPSPSGAGKSSLHRTPKPLSFRLLELLNSLTPAHIQQLHTRFKSYAKGLVLPRDCFDRVFPQIQSYPERLKTAIFNALDLDQDGGIGFTEMCVASIVGTQGDKDQTLAYLFSILDFKHDSKLDIEELDQILGTSFLVLKVSSQNALKDAQIARSAVSKSPSGLKFSEFPPWVDSFLNLPETAKFLRILSNPEEECSEFVRVFEAHLDLVEGDTWFVVSLSWLRIWANYANFDLEQLVPNVQRDLKTASPALSPFPLTNSDLSDEMDSKNLRSSVREGKDFICVHEELWKLLQNTYGGGPAFPRKVVSMENELVINLFPAAVTVYRLQGDSYNKQKRQILMLPVTWTIDKLKTELQLRTSVYDLWHQAHSLWNRVVDSCTLEECLAASGSLRFLITSSDLSSAGQLEILKPNQYRKGSSVRKIRPKDAISEDSNVVGFRGISLLMLSEEEIMQYTQGLLPLAPEEGIQGIPNLGNTCYLNVVLQVLAHCPLLGRYVRMQGFLDRLNVQKNDYLIQMMSVLFRDMMRVSGGFPDPEFFLVLLGQKSDIFQASAEQHDSYECLSVILDVLHTEMKLRTGPIASVKEMTSPTMEQERKLCWEIYFNARNLGTSPIGDLFSNIIESEIRCGNCGFKKVTVSSGFSIYTPLPVSNRIQLKVAVLSLKGEIVHIGVEMDLREPVSRLMEAVSGLCGIKKTSLKLATFQEKRLFVVHLMAVKIRELVENYRGTLFAIEVRTFLPLSESRLEHDHPPPPETPPRSFQDPSPSAQIETVLVKVLNKFVYKTKAKTFGILPSLLSLPRVVTYVEITQLLQDLASRYKKSVFGQEKNPFSLRMLDIRNYSCCVCADPACIGCELPSDSQSFSWENPKGKAPVFVIDWTAEAFEIQGRYDQSYYDIEEKERTGVDFGECLDLFSEEKVTEARCMQCGDRLVSRERIIYPADVLIVTLERFSTDQGKIFKNKHLIKFPVNGLNVGKWLSQDLFPLGSSMSVYDLFAVINHEGSAASGHNTSYCKKDDESENWVYCDDSKLLEVSGEIEEKIVTNAAYILCYRRKQMTGRSIVQLSM